MAENLYNVPGLRLSSARNPTPLTNRRGPRQRFLPMRSVIITDSISKTHILSPTDNLRKVFDEMTCQAARVNHVDGRDLRRHARREPRATFDGSIGIDGPVGGDQDVGDSGLCVALTIHRPLASSSLLGLASFREVVAAAFHLMVAKPLGFRY